MVPDNPVTFESMLQPNIHVIGDACIAGAMPKSAFAANSLAKVCAAAIAKLLARRHAGRAEADQHLLQPGRAGLRDFGRGDYHPVNGQLMEVEIRAA